MVSFNRACVCPGVTSVVILLFIYVLVPKLTSDNTRRDKPLVNRLRLTYAGKNVIMEILKRDEIILMYSLSHFYPHKLSDSRTTMNYIMPYGELNQIQQVLNIYTCCVYIPCLSSSGSSCLFSPSSSVDGISLIDPATPVELVGCCVDDMAVIF